MDNRNYFDFGERSINELISKYRDAGMREASMLGVHHDLEKLKPIIEKIYRENIFYLTWWISDCGFHGWKWSEDDGRMQSMADITNGITDRFKEIYALILCGLGIEKFERSQE